MAKRDLTAIDHNQPEKDKGSLPEGYALAEGTVMKFYSTEFGLIDLSKIDTAQAEQLANAGILKKL